MGTHNIQRHQPQPISHGPHHGPMELSTLRKYLAKTHNNSCNKAAKWGHHPTSAYLEAWNWCNAIAAGITTARPSWLAQRAINNVTDLCPLEFT